MPVLDEEPTVVDDDCTEVELDPEEVEVLVVAPRVEDTTPGIVYALTAATRPTPAIAPMATLAVIRLSIRIAASRARILLSFAWSSSMVPTMAGAAGCFLCETCEFA